MTIVTSCNPVSHVMEQPNHRVWQTIKNYFGAFDQVENLQPSCSFGGQREKNKF